MSERWQEGERGQAVASWLDEIEQAIDDLDALDGLPQY